MQALHHICNVVHGDYLQIDSMSVRILQCCYGADAVVRGHRSGLLTAADYNNLAQCESLDDIKLNLVRVGAGRSYGFGKVRMHGSSINPLF